jgi:DNA polymerase-3 subunit epsilon
MEVMVEEFKRAGLDFELEGRAILDAQVIFHQKEKRDLAAAVQFYCKREMENHHSAEADTRATMDVVLAQVERYTDMPRTVQELSDYCRNDRERFVDAEGKFFWRDGEAVFNFGRFKSQPLRWVVVNHPEYLHWVLSPDRTFSQEVLDICGNALQGKFPFKKTE